MTGRQPYAEQCTRVYTRTGRRAHLLGPFDSPNSHASALCGVVPEWFDAWRGTGSQDETETAASLPPCKDCGRRAVAADEAFRKFGPASPDPAATPPAAAPSPSPPCGHEGKPGPALNPPGAGPGTQTPGSGGSPTPLLSRASSSPPPAVHSAAGTPGPETARPGPAAVRARANTPAGSSGKEWRDRVKAAQSAHNAGKRRGRVRRAPKQAGPGMIRRAAPETPGDAA